MGTYDRRTFLKQSAMLAAAAAAGRLFLPSITGQAAFNQLPVRPLEMLAVGDSVMWGQGLRDEQKFHTLVRRWLEVQLNGRPVNSKIKAHSGATILPKEETRPTCDGEVNFFRPTIYSQLSDAAREYRLASTDLKSIDLVIIDGGINDMGPFTLLKPFVSKQKVRDAANTFCFVEMKKLLSEVVGTFCNARVVVTGYFPIISDETPPEMFLKLILMAFGAPEFIKRLGVGLFNLVRKEAHLKEGEAGPLLKHAAEVSSLWYRESTLALQRAVGDINADIPQNNGCDQSATATPASTDPNNRRVVYALADFKPQNSYGTPDDKTYLWKLVDANRPFNPFEQPIDRLISNDSRFDERDELCKCQEAGKHGLKFKICERAGTAHPNIAGAQEYARAITKELKTLLPFTGWA